MVILFYETLRQRQYTLCFVISQHSLAFNRADKCIPVKLVTFSVIHGAEYMKGYFNIDYPVTNTYFIYLHEI